ncbi:MAG TPA: hypothetical protein VI462_08400 [Acidimicrobiia bacterium]
MIRSSGAYGPFILALNGHSDTCTDFEGGDAPGDPRDQRAVDDRRGGVHIANNLDTYLASIIKPGTLVEIG